MFGFCFNLKTHALHNIQLWLTLEINCFKIKMFQFHCQWCAEQTRQTQNLVCVFKHVLKLSLCHCILSLSLSTFHSENDKIQVLFFLSFPFLLSVSPLNRLHINSDMDLHNSKFVPCSSGVNLWILCVCVWFENDAMEGYRQLLRCLDIFKMIDFSYCSIWTALDLCGPHIICYSIFVFFSCVLFSIANSIDCWKVYYTVKWRRLIWKFFEMKKIKSIHLRPIISRSFFSTKAIKLCAVEFFNDLNGCERCEWMHKNPWKIFKYLETITRRVWSSTVTWVSVTNDMCKQRISFKTFPTDLFCKHTIH